MTVLFFDIDIEGQCELVTEGKNRLEEYEKVGALIANLTHDAQDCNIFQLDPYERTTKVQTK